ncbi:unnamed protein product [Fusarium graminearum]|uniref:Xylanolytic transcriptional activator regulatory domain-containing protein n=1 Tax=Gibberella zeae TaxID=5518 RepID=A0A4E9EG73_GIBZA|nr:unnamed protein product [Fusarium graminearum]
MKGTDNQYSSGSSPNDYALGINRELHVAMSESFIFKKTACSNCHKRKVFQPGHYECSLKEPSSSYHVPSGPSGNCSGSLVCRTRSHERGASYELRADLRVFTNSPHSRKRKHSFRGRPATYTNNSAKSTFSQGVAKTPHDEAQPEPLALVTPEQPELSEIRSEGCSVDQEPGLDQAVPGFWMHIAVGLAHQLGLHKEPSQGPHRGLRRRIWWTIVTRDILISIGVGRPRMINLEDSDVSPPTAADFQEESEGADVFIANIHIVFFVTLIILTNADNPLAAPVTSLIASSFIASMFAEMQEAGDLQRLGPIFAIHSLVAALPLLSAQRLAEKWGSARGLLEPLLAAKQRMHVTAESSNILEPVTPPLRDLFSEFGSSACSLWWLLQGDATHLHEFDTNADDVRAGDYFQALQGTGEEEEEEAGTSTSRQQDFIPDDTTWP